MSTGSESHSVSQAAAAQEQLEGLQGGLGASVIENRALGASSAETLKLRTSLDRARTVMLRNTAQIKLIDDVFLRQFIPDFELAARIIRQIAEGDTASIPVDSRSFLGGDTPGEVAKYCSRFVPYDALSKDQMPAPRLTFPVTATMQFRDPTVPNAESKDAHVQAFVSEFFPLALSAPSATFTSTIELPALVDKIPLSFAEFSELEALDPGHAANIRSAYGMALKLQKEKGASYKDPLIVRMLAALPVGFDYQTQFIPQVSLEEQDRAWDPYLLIGGELNTSSGILRRDSSSLLYSRIPMNVDGREALMSVRRPRPGEREEHEESLLATPSHERDRMGIIIFPHNVIRPEPKRFSEFEGYGGGSFFSGGGSGLMGVKSGPSIGGASIDAGSVGPYRAEKRSGNTSGDQFVPDPEGRPIIYSVRFITVERDLDSISP